MIRTICLTILLATLSAVAAAEQPKYNVYFADLHSHTSYSDGKMKPADAHKYAREVAKLDVFVLTDHLESVNDAEWADTITVVDGANEDGAFVAIPGLEWTKRSGHACLFGPKVREWPKDYPGMYKAAAEAGVLVKFNHPGSGGVFNGLEYSPIGDKAVQMIELRQPKEEPAYIRALDNGWHLAPDGSDDTHSANWGNVRSWTGILAPELTREAIWDAMKNRRIYSTRDRNCRLSFEVNGHQMGSIVEEPAKTVKVAVEVEDPDEGDEVAKFELFEDGKVVETGGTTDVWVVAKTADVGQHYYFVKVTQADGNLLWSAPVWVTVAAE